jgi:capsular polysaccharide biosynthesis protein
MYYSHGDKFYKFVTEFLEILKIDSSDIVILNKDTVYSHVYISSTYTYGPDPKQQPREEIYDLYKEIVENVKELKIEKQFPKKFYISRRTWIHNDFSNIGTNYTTRRKCENENELVDLLKSQGYEEVFTEKLSTVDKILLFNNAESIVGAIGVGIVNVLFSKQLCKLITLVSPTFLDVNYRFTYSLNKVNTYYFLDTKHTESNEFKQFMRVQSENVVGEIEEVLNDEVLVKYSDEKITGWNASITYKTILLKKEKCKKLDNGLNCSWSLNLETLKNII